MGTLVSFETARLLRRQALPQPKHLFVSGGRAPQLPQRHKDIHHLPDPAFLAGVKKLGGTPDEVMQHEELIALLLPLLRADFTMNETYHYTPEPPFLFPISAYCGTKDNEVSEEEMIAWKEQTSNAFVCIMIEGDHFFINSKQGLLLHSIAQELIRMQQH